MGERSTDRKLQPGAAAYETGISVYNSHKLALLTLQSVWFLCIQLTFNIQILCILLTQCMYGFHLVSHRTRIEWSM